MKSTGEVMGIDTSFPAALYKAFMGAGIRIPKQGKIFATIADQDKESALGIIRGFYGLGYRIVATAGTADFLGYHGIRTDRVEKINENQSNQIPDMLKSRDIALVVNTPGLDSASGLDGALIRQTSYQFGIPCLTSLDTAFALLYAIRNQHQRQELKIQTIAEYLKR